MRGDTPVGVGPGGVTGIHMYLHMCLYMYLYVSVGHLLLHTC